MSRARRLTVLVLGVLALPLLARADEWKILADSDWCEDWSHSEWCEVREITLPADRDVIRVDSGGSGGIRVEGWDKKEIRLQVRVAVHRAEDEEEARRVASDVKISTDGTIEPDGPHSRRRGPNWSVEFRLSVPRKSNLRLDSTNGGLSVQDVSGEVALETTNGGLSLQRVSGDVTGRTTNGGIQVELAGKAWEGDGLDLSTTNGGVDLEVPEGFSADLMARTVNGGVRSDVPVALRGSRRDRRIEAKLGKGGAPIRVETTNGGIEIRET
jgi:DUF4097 and DUF4098 domain-containing protein YvlB